MSKKKDAEDEPKKKGGKLKLILLIVLLMAVAGGGTVGGLYAAGLIGHSEKKEPEGPQLVLKGEEDPYAPPAGKDDGGPMVHGEGGSKYRTTYFSFTDDFTANLKGSSMLVQVSLAASTRRDGRVLMWLKEHELKVRSRMLVELSNTPAETINTPEGKQDMQKRLTKAINQTLIEEEGFGGVDNVHFRTLIVQ